MLVRVTGDEPEERDVYSFSLRQLGLMVDQHARFSETIDVWESAPADLVVVLRPPEASLPEFVTRFRDLSRAPLVLLLDSAALCQSRCRSRPQPAD
jgi:DNA-binding response OmpR family regulator